jgi:hypothetical protein
MYEPATGREWPVKYQGQAFFGVEPQWSPDGNWIAFICWNPNEIGIVKPDGSDLKVLFKGECIESQVHWYHRLGTGNDGVVFPDGCQGGFFFVDPNTGGAVRFRSLGPYDEFSPDGSELVTIRMEATDSLGLLFIQSVDDFSDATLFQITHYAPPESASTSQRAEPIALAGSSLTNQEVGHVGPQPWARGARLFGDGGAGSGAGAPLDLRDDRLGRLGRFEMYLGRGVHAGGGSAADRLPDSLYRPEQLERSRANHRGGAR